MAEIAARSAVGTSPTTPRAVRWHARRDFAAEVIDPRVSQWLTRRTSRPRAGFCNGAGRTRFRPGAVSLGEHACCNPRRDRRRRQGRLRTYT